MDDRTLAWINELPHREACEAFRRCCGASAWCAQMASARPYSSFDAMLAAAETAFDSLSSGYWLEAFACHPKIGDLKSLQMKYAGNRDWSAGEQSGVADANYETLRRLAAGNKTYEIRYGYLFIVCASGKSADQMLSLLEARLRNSPEDELLIAAAEQRKITRLRLAKMTPPTEM